MKLKKCVLLTQSKDVFIIYFFGGIFMNERRVNLLRKKFKDFFLGDSRTKGNWRRYKKKYSRGQL